MIKPRIRSVAAALLALALAGCVSASAGRAPRTVTVGIAAINDFHGHLEPPGQAAMISDGKGGSVAVPAGGAAFLASTVHGVRAKYPHHLTVAAGDLIGSSPLASALFADEPAIEVLSRIGLDYASVGNHEFDAGVSELLRKQTGGCAKLTQREPCQLERFRGAAFRYLAANAVRADGRTLFAGAALKTFGHGRRKVRVGLIGMTLRGTANLVRADVGKDVTFRDEADTANALVSGLKRRGADAVVVLIHEGGATTGSPDPDGCAGLNGAIGPILDRLDPRVDLVVSGHTHRAYVCEYGAYNKDRPFLLTSAGLWGAFVTDIALEIDPTAHRVVARRARNMVVQSEPFSGVNGPVPVTDAAPRGAPDAGIAAYVARYAAAAKVQAVRKAGWLAEPLPAGPLGYLVADAQLAATAGAGARIACTNPFGVRRALPVQPDNSVTYGDLYLTQPFGNYLVTLTLNGAELKQVLEQQMDGAARQQILACSAGFVMTIDRTRAAGERVTAITLAGEPIDPAREYRVTVNTFLANGGDRFTGFLAGRERTVGMSDLAALEAYLQGASPMRSGPHDTRVIDLTATSGKP